MNVIVVPFEIERHLRYRKWTERNGCRYDDLKQGVLAFSGGEIVGFAGIYNCIGLLNEIVVNIRPGFETQGIEKAMIKAVSEQFFYNYPTVASVQAVIDEEDQKEYNDFTSVGYNRAFSEDELPIDRLLYTLKSPYY